MHIYTRMASIQLISWNLIEMHHLNPKDVFNRAGLDPQEMYKEDGRYSPNQIAALWREMERVIPDPCFGLKAGDCWHPAYIGTLGFSLLMSHSLREVFERYVRFSTVVSGKSKCRFVENFENETATFHYPEDHKELRIPAREAALMSWAISLLRVIFKNLIPISVNFSYDEPEYTAKARYFEVFKTAVTFGNTHPSFVISTKDVEKPLAGGNADLIEKSDQVLAAFLAKQNEKTPCMTTRTMGAIIEHLATGNATVEVIAAQFGISGKTLQRRLKEENTRFSEIYNNTRKDLACNYLRNKKKDIAEIAFLLGFSDQSSFSRSFKNWIGESPTEYRIKIES